MKRVAAYFAAWLLLTCSVWLGLQDRGNAWWQSVAQLSVGGAAYAGPGDIVSGAKTWYGFRGYNAAFSGNVANICDAATGLVCADVTWSAGVLTVPTIGGSVCNNVTVLCKIKTLYDQSGATQCSAAACDVTQATNASRPSLTLSAVGSAPCATFATGNGLAAAGAITSVSQVFTTSFVAKATVSNDFHAVINNTAGTVAAGYGNISDITFAYTNNLVPFTTATTNAFHAIQSIFNSSSTIISVDAVDATGKNLGNTNAFTGTVELGGKTGGFQFQGVMCEAGLWGTGFSTGNNSSMSANQHSYWGF